jgi:hypothetical protein
VEPEKLSSRGIQSVLGSLQDVSEEESVRGRWRDRGDGDTLGKGSGLLKGVIASGRLA